MVFSAGIGGFFEDIKCAAQCAIYDVTHPEIWGLDGACTTNDYKDDLDSVMNLLDNMVGNEDIKKLVELIRKISDANITKEEYDMLMEKLRGMTITISVDDIMKAMEPPSQGPEKPEESVKFNELEETDEEDRINLKDAIMETPLGKSLFQYIEKEEKKADAAAATASA